MSGPEGYGRLLTEAASRALNYLETIPSRRVVPSEEALGNLKRLGGRLPEDPEDSLTILRLLDEIGSPATVGNNGGRYFGFVVGGALPSTVAANWLAGAWDQNASVNVLSPIAAHLEADKRFKGAGPYIARRYCHINAAYVNLGGGSRAHGRLVRCICGTRDLQWPPIPRADILETGSELLRQTAGCTSDHRVHVRPPHAPARSGADLRRSGIPFVRVRAPWTRSGCLDVRICRATG